MVVQEGYGKQQLEAEMRWCAGVAGEGLGTYIILPVRALRLSRAEREERGSGEPPFHRKR
jgi:hypothetical protein